MINFNEKFSTPIKPLFLFSQSSLTDIILLLLIFFLLTSTFIINYGIEIYLPEASYSNPTEQQQIVVAITKDKQFFINGENVVREILSTEIRSILLAQQTPTLVIYADKNTSLDDVVYVINIGKALNLPIYLATEPFNQL